MENILETQDLENLGNNNLSGNNLPKNNSAKKDLTYDRLFIIFMIGNILGVLLEGTFCFIAKGHWESHVVTIYGAFNLLYGCGVLLFYVGVKLLGDKSTIYKVIVLMLSATVLELICGLLLRNVLGMKAWDYSHKFLNYKGIICPKFSIAWGAVAYLFCKISVHIDEALRICHGRLCHIVCVAMGIFMVINISLTAMSLVRWSERHYGFEAKSSFEHMLDKETPDYWMKSRFIEWKFLDDNFDN